MSSPAEASTNDPARILGTRAGEHYQVLRWLGTGSMSAVYEVEDVRTHAVAAMKVLLPAYGEDKLISARFVREAKAMSMFEHRNIVDVCDLGRFDDGTLFLVTDLVRGVSLRAVIDDGVIEPRRALAIMRQVLEALDHAHAVGVIHRDVKPENIMLADGGCPDRDADFVKMLDFGIAKLLGDAMSVLGESALTQTGFNILGTAAYMAPEPILNRPIDARTDLYSVGCVLFELLTGKPPYDHEDPMALLRLHATAPSPTLAAAAPERAFTPELEYLIADALAKKPEHRCKSAAKMIAALDLAAHSLEPLDLRPQQLAEPRLPPDKGTLHSLVPPVAPASRPMAIVPPAPHIPMPFQPAPRIAMAPQGRWPSTPRDRRRIQIVVAGLGALIAFTTVASLTSGDAPSQPSQHNVATVAQRSSDVPRPRERSATDYLEQGHAELKQGRRLDALAAYERAIAMSAEVASDDQLRANVASILNTRDTIAAVIALEILATRLEPPALDAIIGQASNGKVGEVRRRSFAIAERDGFDDKIDRAESWSMDLEQATTCDDRKRAIAKLRSLGDRRAVAALKRTRKQHACVKQDATDAIAQLETRPQL